MKTAITGASGQLGRLVVEKLKQKVSPESLVALVRNPEKADGAGIEVRKFDYSNSDAASLTLALEDVDTLLLISGSEIGQRIQQHKNVISAAKDAGVKRIVYTSLLHADKSSLILAPEHFATEEAIFASGIAYTILRNGWYTENYTASVPGSVAAGAFIGSAADGKISSAAREDYADAAVFVLTGEGYDGKTIELAGDEAYTLTDLAAEISRQTGKEIPYQNLPEASYAEALKGFGLPEMLAGAYASLDVSASKGDLFYDGKELSKLIGRPTTTLSEIVKGALS